MQDTRFWIVNVPSMQDSKAGTERPANMPSWWTNRRGHRPLVDLRATEVHQVDGKAYQFWSGSDTGWPPKPATQCSATSGSSGSGYSFCMRAAPEANRCARSCGALVGPWAALGRAA